MTPDQFTTLLANIPYRPSGANATGLLAPLIRSMGHVLYLMAVLAQEAAAPEGTAIITILTDEEKVNELAHAAAHLAAPALEPVTDSPILSTACKTTVTTYALGVLAARDSFAEWGTDDRLTCLRTLANAAAGLAAFLDRELAGFPADRSDPGTSL